MAQAKRKQIIAARLPGKRRDFLPLAVPDIGEAEISEVVSTLRSGWLTMGPKTKIFERRFAKYIGVRYAIALNSCTAALHLALLAHDVGPGDEVILPSFTFAATANMVVNVGARPVFADIEPDTFNLDPLDISRKITKRTRAIIPVHLAGHPADLLEIMKIAKRYRFVVIEDAAHAVGSKLNGKRIGTFGNTTCFSFYATKTMTTGEGGMLTTDNAKIADFVEKNRLHGISKDAWKRYTKVGSWRYEVEYSGWKYNMTDIQASLGIHQLKKVNSFIRKRNLLALVYDKELSSIKGITRPVKQNGVKHAYHLYPILINAFGRDIFIKRMSKQKIGTSVHFLPLHLQPFYRKRFGYRKGDLPITEEIAQRIVSLPLYPAMSDDDVRRVITAVKRSII